MIRFILTNRQNGDHVRMLVKLNMDFMVILQVNCSTVAFSCFLSLRICVTGILSGILTHDQ